jgi:hypothetical protein
MKKTSTQDSLSLHTVKKFLQIRNSTVNFFDNIEVRKGKLEQLLQMKIMER